MKSLSDRYIDIFRAQLGPEIRALQEKLANSSFNTRGSKELSKKIHMILKNSTIDIKNITHKKSFVTLNHTAHCLQNRKY